MRHFTFRDVETGKPFAAAWDDSRPTPEIGAVLTIQGKTAKRIPSPTSVDTAQTRDYSRGVVSRSLPRNMPGFDHNERGQVIIKSESDARRAESVAGMARE